LGKITERTDLIKTEIITRIYLNAKMIPVETVPGIGVEGMERKESSGGGEFKYGTFDTS
jgi:hypothetical protein